MANNHKKKNKNKRKRLQRAKDASNIEKHAEEQIDDQENESEVLAEPDVNPSGNNSTKRHHDDDADNSDVEEKPQKKKKKKQPIATDTTDKKGKKSIRQMKREKFAERQAEAQAASKDQLKSQCLNYLSQWKHDKQNWKFMKAKQVWLYKNKFSTYLLPDSSWPLLLEYFESAQGNIRNMLLDDAKKIIKQMDEWTESKDDQTEDKDEEEDDETETATKTKKPDDSVYKRARDLIQCLEEYTVVSFFIIFFINYILVTTKI